jgi:hypothetical protein
MEAAQPPGMEKIEIRHHQVYRLAPRHGRGSKLAQLLRHLLHKRH